MQRFGVLVVGLDEGGGTDGAADGPEIEGERAFVEDGGVAGGGGGELDEREEGEEEGGGGWFGKVHCGGGVGFGE